MRSDNIRTFRNVKGLSMDQVREMTGLSKSTISDSENPTGNPTEKTLEKLALVYGVDVKDFYREELLVDKDYRFTTNLSFSQFDSLIKWSEDRLFKKHETVAIRSHMAELFLRYKVVIEQLAYTQRQWDKSKESFSKFYKEKSEPLSDREIKELFLKQELEENIDRLASWAKNLPSWVSLEEEKYLTNEMKISNNNVDSHLIPDAAHEIGGSSTEDKAHDDAIMDDDDF